MAFRRNDAKFMINGHRYYVGCCKGMDIDSQKTMGFVIS
jgi:hypothetical protein